MLLQQCSNTTLLHLPAIYGLLRTFFYRNSIRLTKRGNPNPKLRDTAICPLSRNILAHYAFTGIRLHYIAVFARYLRPAPYLLYRKSSSLVEMRLP